MAWHVLYRLKAEGILYQLVYHTFRLHRSLGYESTFKEFVSWRTQLCDTRWSVVVITAGKLRLQSQKDNEWMLEDSASGDDDVSSESDKSSEFESGSDCEIEDPQRKKLEREREVECNWG